MQLEKHVADTTDFQRFVENKPLKRNFIDAVQKSNRALSLTQKFGAHINNQITEKENRIKNSLKVNSDFIDMI